jgi:hypothetical protein
MAKPTETFVPITTLRAICGGAEAVELDHLLKSGRIKVRSGQAPLVDGVRTFLAAVRAGAADADLGAAMTAARTARAEAAELAQQVEARVLIPDADAEAAMLAVAGAVISAFAAIPAMASRVVTERRMIEGILFEAQTAMSKAVAAADLQLPETQVKAKTKGKAG